MPELYLGLMSGTSVDGIDVAVVDLSADGALVVHADTFAWHEALRRRILTTLQNPTCVPLRELGELDAAIGTAFGEAALTAVGAAGLDTAQIGAIGSHGQTLFHAPSGPQAFSMQSGDPNRIAELTGITTVADFRRRDIAAGGQGAPLVPAFHRAIFADPRTSRAILNIGGMANLTLLPRPPAPVSGFDTGPGNVLLDTWHQKHRQAGFDENGAWGAGGQLDEALLERLLDHPYFRQQPPKSTGRELFCLRWLEDILASGAWASLPAEDVQRTLAEFSAATIAGALERFCGNVEQVLVCGGGAHNVFLMQRLAALLSPRKLDTTEAYGLHPDWVEASAFAWLAKRTLDRRPGNVPDVTGARRAVVLGAVYPGG